MLTMYLTEMRDDWSRWGHFPSPAELADFASRRVREYVAEGRADEAAETARRLAWYARRAQRADQWGGHHV